MEIIGYYLVVFIFSSGLFYFHSYIHPHFYFYFHFHFYFLFSSSPEISDSPAAGQKSNDFAKVLAPKVTVLKIQKKIQTKTNILSLVLSFCTPDSFCVSFVTRKSSWGAHLWPMYGPCMAHLSPIYPSCPPPPRVSEKLLRELPGVPDTDSCFVSKMLYHTDPTKQESAHEHA